MFGRILQGLKVLIRMSWSWCAKNLIFLRFTTPIKNQRPYKLRNDLLDIPGGLKQKIALARTFYKSPKFIVLDEPTSSLDAQFENKFLDIIKTHKERGALIVIITHNKEILKMADYILALKEGRQKLFDTKENIKTKMKMPL